MFLMFLCQNGRVYVKIRKINVFVKPNEHCHGEKTHFSRNERRTFSSFTYPLVFLLTYPFANMLANVNYSARNLTL